MMTSLLDNPIERIDGLPFLKVFGLNERRVQFREYRGGHLLRSREYVGAEPKAALLTEKARHPVDLILERRTDTLPVVGEEIAFPPLVEALLPFPWSLLPDSPFLQALKDFEQTLLDFEFAALEIRSTRSGVERRAGVLLRHVRRRRVACSNLLEPLTSETAPADEATRATVGEIRLDLGDLDPWLALPLEGHLRALSEALKPCLYPPTLVRPHDILRFLAP